MYVALEFNPAVSCFCHWAVGFVQCKQYGKSYFSMYVYLKMKETEIVEMLRRLHTSGMLVHFIAEIMCLLQHETHLFLSTLATYGSRNVSVVQM